MHDIGKNLVRMMIEGKGIEIIDLGVDVDPQDFVKCAIENDCKASSVVPHFLQLPCQCLVK